MIQSLAERRRKWVYTEFGKRTEGTSMKNSDKTKLMKKLWKQAKKDIK